MDRANGLVEGGGGGRNEEQTKNDCFRHRWSVLNSTPKIIETTSEIHHDFRSERLISHSGKYIIALPQSQTL